MKHLIKNNETYLSHFIFASKIALHLYISSFCLITHAIIPFWNIPESFNLIETHKKMLAWNDYAEKRKQK